MKKFIFSFMVGVLWLTASFAQCEPTRGTTNQESGPIVLGALIHLSGDLAMQGNAFREGIELALEEVNTSGGIGGRSLEVVFEDTQLKASLSFTGAKKLIEHNRVASILVSTLAEAKPIGPYTESRKIPILCLWDTAPELEELGDYSFGIGTWAPSTGLTVAHYAYHQLGLRKAAVIDYPDEWAISVAETFKSRFKELGGEIVFQETIDAASSDHRAVFTRMIGNNPDMLYIPVGQNVVALHKQIHDLKFSGAVFQSDNLNQEIISAAGDALEKVYQTQTSDPTGQVFYKFSQLYQAKHGTPPTLPLFNAWGYDGVMLLAEIMKKVGPDSERIKQEMYKVQGYSGASGTISISKKGSSRMEVSLFQVRNGKLVLVNEPG